MSTNYRRGDDQEDHRFYWPRTTRRARLSVTIASNTRWRNEMRPKILYPGNIGGPSRDSCDHVRLIFEYSCVEGI